MLRSRRRREGRLVRSRRNFRILPANAGQVAAARGRAKKRGLGRSRLLESERSSQRGGCDIFDSGALNSDGWIDLMNRWMYRTTRWLSGWLIQSESIQKYQSGRKGWLILIFCHLSGILSDHNVGVCKMVTEKVRYEVRAGRVGPCRRPVTSTWPSTPALLQPLHRCRRGERPPLPRCGPLRVFLLVLRGV